MLISSPISGAKLQHIPYKGAAQMPAAMLADIPTVAESGFPGFEVDSRYGLLAPYGTPPEIIARLNKVLGDTVQQRDVREQLAAMGIDVIQSTPERYAAAIRSDQEKYAKVISALGISLE